MRSTSKRSSGLQERRNEIVNGELNEIGPQIERKLTEIMNGAFEADDAEAAVYAGRVLRNLLLGRLYVMRFLVDNDEASYQRVMQEFEALGRPRRRCAPALQNPQRRRLATEVEDLVASTATPSTRFTRSIVDRNASSPISSTSRPGRSPRLIEDFKLAIKEACRTRWARRPPRPWRTPSQRC
jgi:methyl-accepting chemotaxis protein